MANYATLADLPTYGVNLSALPAWITTGMQQAQIDAWNAKVDSYLSSKFKLPITSWGKDLTQAVAVLAAYELICLRGFDPESQGDVIFKQRAEREVTWLESIRDGDVVPTVVDSSAGLTDGGLFARQATSDQGSGVVKVAKPTLRGW